MAKAKRAKAKPKPLEIAFEKLDLQRMITQWEHKYLMVNLLARRARQLNEGARPLVTPEGPYTPLQIAIAEAANGRLGIERREKPRIVVDLVENN